MFYDCVCILFFRTTFTENFLCDIFMKTSNASTHVILIVTLEDRSYNFPHSQWRNRGLERLILNQDHTSNKGISGPV